MAIERWRPFETEMNRLFDTVFGPPASASSGERIWAPLCDMWETKDEVVLSFELPGVSEKDVNVSITGDRLTVKGERRFQQDAAGDSDHRLERTYGKLARTVQLPMRVQADEGKATYRDGVLMVKLPKADEVKPKEFKIDLM